MNEKKKTIKKLFLYEGKRLLAAPAFVFAVFLVFELSEFIIFRKNAAMLVQREKYTETFLYLFYAALSASFLYREFAGRKLYEKVRISPQRLFLVRLCLIVGACFAFVTVALLLGSLRMVIYRWLDPESYAKFDYQALFVFQGKTPWYFLFGFSVGMAAAITYSFVVYLKTLFFSKMRWWNKVLALAALFCAWVAAHILPMVTDFALFNGLYGCPLPCGPMAYQRAVDAYYPIANYGGTHWLIGSEEAEVVLCYVAWNISNVASLVSGLLIVFLGYCSLSAFKRKENESYLYQPKTEVKNESDV